MKKTVIALGMASGLAVAAPALAQQQQQAPGQQMGAAAAAQAQANPAMQGRRAVMGEVIDTRVFQLRNAQGQMVPHRLVKLRNAEGRVIVVDLGASERVATPQRGQTFVAIGKEARINGRPVLFASYAGDVSATGGLMARQQGAR